MVVVVLLISLLILAAFLYDGLTNIANSLIIRGLINKGMTPEEVKEYIKRLKNN